MDLHTSHEKFVASKRSIEKMAELIIDTYPTLQEHSSIVYNILVALNTEGLLAPMNQENEETALSYLNKRSNFS